MVLRGLPTCLLLITTTLIALSFARVIVSPSYKVLPRPKILLKLLLNSRSEVNDSRNSSGNNNHNNTAHRKQQHKVHHNSRCSKNHPTAKHLTRPKSPNPVPIQKCEIQIKTCYDTLVAHGGKLSSAKKDMILINCVKIYPCPSIKKRICLKKQVLSSKLQKACKQWKPL